MRAAYAAEDAGEIERSLGLVNAALDELDPGDNPRERIEALLVKARTTASLMTGVVSSHFGRLSGCCPKTPIPQLRARVLEMLARRTMLSGDVRQGIEFSQQAVERRCIGRLGLGHGERVDHVRHQPGCGRSGD